MEGPFPLQPGGLKSHYFQEQFEMWTHQTTAHFPTLGQSISEELGPREVTVSGCCLYMAMILQHRALT